MNTQEKYNHFKDLHKKEAPIILYNVWNAGSAKATVDSGATILATGSKPMALSQGYPDGEIMPFNTVLETIKQIVNHVAVPVSVDFEGGYAGDNNELLAENTKQLLETGIVGLNFEDQIIAGKGLYNHEIQAERIRTIRKVAIDMEVPLFINARTDIFMHEKDKTKHKDLIEESIKRANSYQDAGADCFFAPGIEDLGLIQELCKALNLPVNIVKSPTVPENKKLALAGVRRISYGPFAYLDLMKTFGERAKNEEQYFR